MKKFVIIACILIVSVGIISAPKLSKLFLSIFTESGYDSFGNCKRGLVSANTRYKIGDSIELKFVISSNAPRKIRLFEEKQKSLFLSVSPDPHLSFAVYGYNKVTKVSGQYFSWYIKNDKTLRSTETTDSITVDKDKPYILVVQGIIIKDVETGNIIFDFGDFGKFEMLKPSETYYINGFWRPIKPHPWDQLEDFTNKIKISVSDP